jgi:hypothetical protein
MPAEERQEPEHVVTEFLATTELLTEYVGAGDESRGVGDRSRPSHWSGRRALIANQNKENTGYTLARQKPD